jgi:site-specific recombinase XerD
MRDYALLLFLYNTGARAAEAARLTVADLSLDSPASARILDRCQNYRNCPLAAPSVAALRRLVFGRHPGAAVFRGRRGQPMTRFAIYQTVSTYAKVVARRIPMLADKRVSPYTLRQTAAAHLLRGGVDLPTLRALLGCNRLTAPADSLKAEHASSHPHILK